MKNRQINKITSYLQEIGPLLENDIDAATPCFAQMMSELAPHGRAREIQFLISTINNVEWFPAHVHLIDVTMAKDRLKSCNVQFRRKNDANKFKLDYYVGKFVQISPPDLGGDDEPFTWFHVHSVAPVQMLDGFFPLPELECTLLTDLSRFNSEFKPGVDVTIGRWTIVAVEEAVPEDIPSSSRQILSSRNN